MVFKIWDTLFEVINIEVQCSKNKFKVFLQQEAGAFGNNLGKELQNLGPKLKNMYIKYLLKIFVLLAIQWKR